MKKGTNKIPLYLRDGRKSNFSLHEFANREGLVCLHWALLEAVQAVRDDLSAECGEEVALVITDGTRTLDDLKRLAAKLGWIKDGGLVAKDSKHLHRHGGIGVDFKALYASNRKRVQLDVVVRVSQKHFDWVKSYKDGHVHGDLRNKAK
jgi:hypothetical protein